MASIERTAYPGFRRTVTAREFVGLSPTVDEISWARGQTRSESHLLALVLSLKCFQRLGSSPTLEEIPEVVVRHIRRSLGLKEEVGPTRAERTAKTHRALVRTRLGVIYDPDRAQSVAEDAIRSAAAVKNNPPDLINVALEMLVKASLELPGFSRLDRMTSRIRSEVNTAMFELIVSRISLPDRVRLEALLEVVGPKGKSEFNRLKQAAGRASWSAFREQVQHLAWVDSLGDTRVWLEGIAATKIADFAGEASAADAGVMGDVAPLKRTALLACMVHAATMRARDDLAEMFCKRTASITKRAKDELEAIRARQAEMSERLIVHYRDLLVRLDPRGEAADEATALQMARSAVEEAGGFDAELADIDAVSAHHAHCAGTGLEAGGQVGGWAEHAHVGVGTGEATDHSGARPRPRRVRPGCLCPGLAGAASTARGQWSRPSSLRLKGGHDGVAGEFEGSQGSQGGLVPMRRRRSLAVGAWGRVRPPGSPHLK
jgi:hypothetical protein